MSVWGYVANMLVDCDTLQGIWMYMQMSRNCRIRFHTHASAPLLTRFLSIAFFFFFFSRSNLFTAAVFLHIQNVLTETNIRRWDGFRWSQSLLSEWWSIKLPVHWVCSLHYRRPTRNRSVAFPVYSIHIPTITATPTPAFFRNFDSDVLAVALGKNVRGNTGTQLGTLWTAITVSTWCWNFSNTKEMPIDFRRKRPRPGLVSTQGKRGGAHLQL